MTQATPIKCQHVIKPETDTENAEYCGHEFEVAGYHDMGSWESEKEIQCPECGSCNSRDFE